jgi:tRNA(Ile)-lysidine synthase
MSTINDTIEKVGETISHYGMIDAGDRIIVAVSGGADSVCLLDILHSMKDELGITLVVAHYDHGMRPSEDWLEGQFVQGLAQSMNLPFETEKGSILTEESTASVEERARNARYRFLEEVKNRYHAHKIAVGHSLNDQAETVLMRLLRGSGPSGLAGIPPSRDNTIIRPLIELQREEIESYLKARELSYATDSSNFETKYLRNKVRLHLLPLLLEYQPRLIEHLGRLADILSSENEYMELQAEDWVEKEAEQGSDGEISVSVPSFIALSPPLRNRATRYLIKKIGKKLRRIDYGHIQSVYRLATSHHPQGAIDLPHGLTIEKRYNTLCFMTVRKQKPQEFCNLIECPGTFFLGEIGRSISLVEVDVSGNTKLENFQWIAHLDAGKIHYPLVVRNFRPGDRFIPLGMTGHKKIKNFFIDLKIPSDMRASIPIVVSQNIPVWICGYRIDDRFKVTPETKKILKVTIS